MMASYKCHGFVPNPTFCFYFRVIQCSIHFSIFSKYKFSANSSPIFCFFLHAISHKFPFSRIQISTHPANFASAWECINIFLVHCVPFSCPTQIPFWKSQNHIETNPKIEIICTPEFLSAVSKFEYRRLPIQHSLCFGHYSKKMHSPIRNTNLLSISPILMALFALLLPSLLFFTTNAQQQSSSADLAAASMLAQSLCQQFPGLDGCQPPQMEKRKSAYMRFGKRKSAYMR